MLRNDGVVLLRLLTPF